LRDKFAQVSDPVLMIMLAITVVDELAQSGQRVTLLAEKITSLQKAKVAVSDHNEAAQSAIVSVATHILEWVKR
jgi:cell division protein ZapA (FtsZ GTPase activity inhibitor)